MRKIFGIGLSRTGTNSLCGMMEALGFEAIHLPLSLQQIHASAFANGTPVAARFEALDLQYPGSKFIYTIRDSAAWVASCLEWFEPDSRRRWLEQLPDEESRRWISEADVKLYGIDDLALSGISRGALMKAYARHEALVMNHFRDRPEDLLVLDITNSGSLPYSQLVQFLEKNQLLCAPCKDSSKPVSEISPPASSSAVDPFQATDSLQLAEAQVRLARVWSAKGKKDLARQKYERALWLIPDHVEALHELGKVLIEQDQADMAIAHFVRALDSHPNESQLHKGLADAFEVFSGLDAAFSHYGLKRADCREIELGPDDLLCCLVVRNEARRLPFFLSYYRDLGVSKFLVVDNDSEDTTPAYLLEQPDVHVWHSAFSFNRANFGSAWFELLLRRYGLGHWCLIVDIDELLYFPACEHRNLVQLCHTLERKGKKAFSAVLLDMYSDLPVDQVVDRPGQDFREVCPWFDRAFYTTRLENAGPYKNQTLYFGGVRRRVMGPAAAYLLSKVPLLKYAADTLLAGGQHWSNCAADHMAGETGCLLHFKFMSTFRAYVAGEIERKQHYQDATQYQAYHSALRREQGLQFYDSRHSVRLEDSAQLVRLGIMTIDPDEQEEPAAVPAVPWPEISPLPVTGKRIFWSVMITVYQRTTYLQRALSSVLGEVRDSSPMQITVVSDCTDPEIRSEIQSIVDQHGDARVSLYQSTETQGHPEIFNTCVRQALGQWVHILHDDDWILPGFYRAMERGIAAEPGLGAAFCRVIHADTSNHTRWVSWMERETAGVPARWLERLALSCRLQFSSVVVRREAYEKLGGFDAGAHSAFDWDMWKRLAIGYPFWFEPEILSVASKDGHAETNRLQRSGQQIAHSRISIERSHRLFPRSYTDELSQRACVGLAHAALGLATQNVANGDFAAAFANISEGLRCSQSDSVTRSLLALLAGKTA